MNTQILTTKLHIPSARTELVQRTELIQKLNAGLHKKLTLVSAPAGFGKSTLISVWLSQNKRSTAWLSLDEEDLDLARFIRYLVAGIQSIDSKIGEAVLKALSSPQPPSTESILTSLINEIAQVMEDFIFVLDDYHLINGSPINEVLSFLIEHLPSQMHLVIITREDPGLPLARLRVKNQLSELRISELRFSSDEVKTFLNLTTNQQFSNEDIQAIEARTEGWIASLQLAALSMRQSEDVSQFIKEFTGTHRFVLDYLLEEILYRQAENIQNFLVKTSILERICGSLCDALLDDVSNSSQQILEQLEYANLLLVPLDEHRQWYRYHHLFSEALQARLMKNDRNHFLSLHSKACEWYEQYGLRSDAIKHAFLAEDFQRAADLIELTWSRTLEEFDFDIFIDRVKQLPAELIHQRPIINAGYAWSLIIQGNLDAGEKELQFAERGLSAFKDIHNSEHSIKKGMIIVDQMELPKIAATIATARAFYSQMIKDLSNSVKFAKQALRYIPENDEFRRAIPTGILGFSYWELGDLKKAEEYLWDSRVTMQRVDQLAAALSGTSFLALIKFNLGKLQEAIRLFEDSIKLAEKHDRTIFLGRADLYFGLAELELECGTLDLAKQSLSKGEDLLDQSSPSVSEYRRLLAISKIEELQGNLDEALNLIIRAEQFTMSDLVPNPRPIPALKARIWIKQNNVDAARIWIKEQALTPDDPLNYIVEFEHITLARLLITEYQQIRDDKTFQIAHNFLLRLSKEAQTTGRIGSLIEILVLQAILYFLQEKLESAVSLLVQALNYAEAEGFVRMFINEGQIMAELFNAALKSNAISMKQDPVYQFIHQLETNLGQNDDEESVISQPLPDALSERELDVLRLLYTDMSGPEIANKLNVSLNTMRTHTKSIYTKLDVNGRRAAVSRSQELNLL